MPHPSSRPLRSRGSFCRQHPRSAGLGTAGCEQTSRMTARSGRAGDAGHGQAEGGSRGARGRHSRHRGPHHQLGRRQGAAQGVRQPRRHPERVRRCVTRNLLLNDPDPDPNFYFDSARILSLNQTLKDYRNARSVLRRVISSGSTLTDHNRECRPSPDATPEGL